MAVLPSSSTKPKSSKGSHRLFRVLGVCAVVLIVYFFVVFKGEMGSVDVSWTDTLSGGVVDMDKQKRKSELHLEVEEVNAPRARFRAADTILPRLEMPEDAWAEDSVGANVLAIPKSGGNVLIKAIKAMLESKQ